MNMKKALVLVGSLAILGSGFAFGQSRDKDRNVNRNEVRKRTETQPRYQYRFVDENGDGINDFFRDHDGDGVPNCQDSDWTRPKDGTGNKGRFGTTAGAGGPVGMKQGFRGRSQGMTGGAGRGGQRALGGGVCDGTGPKGSALRGKR